MRSLKPKLFSQIEYGRADGLIWEDGCDWRIYLEVRIWLARYIDPVSGPERLAPSRVAD